MLRNKELKLCRDPVNIILCKRHVERLGYGYKGMEYWLAAPNMCTKTVVGSVPVCDSLLQLSQKVLVELIELRQVVEDLIQHPLLHHRLPTGTSRLGNRIPEVLSRKQKCYRQIL